MVIAWTYEQRDIPVYAHEKSTWHKYVGFLNVPKERLPLKDTNFRYFKPLYYKNELE